ncbi:lysostaphin resistance A-like protein [Gemmatimonadota bacterium]
MEGANDPDLILSPGPSLANSDPFERVRFRDSLIWVIGVMIIIPVLSAAIFAMTGDSLVASDLPALMLYSFYLGFILWIIRQNRLAGVDFDRLMGAPPAQFRYTQLVPLVLALLAVAIVCLVGILGLFSVLEMDLPGMGDDGDSFSFNNIGLINQAIGVLLLAPIIEEIVFRGYFLHRFNRKWNLKAAIFVSSALFAILHTNVPGTFVFALVACCLYIRTRSLLVPIAMHAIYNSFPFGLSLLMRLIVSIIPEGALEAAAGDPAIPGDTIDDPGTMIFMAGCCGMALLLILIPSLIYLVKWLKANWPEEDRDLPYFADPEDEDTMVFRLRR